MKRFSRISPISARARSSTCWRSRSPLQDRPQPRALAGKILGLVFFNPSLRTLASFQAGMARLGGTSFVITPGQGTWQLETRLNAVMNGAAAEHIREGIPVLASYCDALGVRAFAEGKNLESDLRESLFRQVDALCDKPLINLESAMNHPCQALADWRTLDELEMPDAREIRAELGLSPAGAAAGGGLGRRCTWPQCAAWRWSWRGPTGYALPPRDHGEGAPRRGASRRLGHRDLRPRGRARGASVLYAKEWGGTAHYGDAEADARAARRAERLVRARALVRRRRCRRPSSCTACPCAATSRSTDEVLDGPRAVVRREAFNRLIVQMAVLHRMLS